MTETTEALFAERKQLIISTVQELPLLDYQRIELAMDCFGMLLDGHTMHRILLWIEEHRRQAA